MELNIAIAILIAILGSFIGIIIARMTLDEYDDIEKYLRLSEFGLFLIISIFSMMRFEINIWVAIILLAIIGFTLYLIKMPYTVIYLVFGLIISISISDVTALFVNSSLIFAYGIIMATFMSHKVKYDLKNTINKVIFNSIPLLLPVVIFIFA
jgi:hypothetical protein